MSSGIVCFTLVLIDLGVWIPLALAHLPGEMLLLLELKTHTNTNNYEHMLELHNPLSGQIHLFRTLHHHAAPLMEKNEGVENPNKTNFHFRYKISFEYEPKINLTLTI